MIMKSGSAFLLSGIVILIIGIVWLVVGWPGGNPAIQGFGPVPVTSQSPVTTPAGLVTEAPTRPQTPEPSLVPSPDAVKMHLIDIAFGEDNILLQRWDPAKNNGRIVISVTGGNTGDIRNLEAAARQFNALSATNQLAGNIKQDSQGDISVKFIPESGMSGIALNASNGNTLKEFTVDGVTAVRIIPGSIYLNANLKGDVRNHTLIRSLYYTLGVVGDSDTYQDSVFYSGINTNTNLSYSDQKALELLYGKRLQPGMTAGEVKEILYIK